MGYKISAFLNKNDNEKCLGIASLEIDKSFKITNISIYQGKTGPFIAMPRLKFHNKNGEIDYKNVANPITKEFRQQLYTDILNTFENAQKSSEGKAMFESVDIQEKANINVIVKPIVNREDNLKGFANIILNNNFAINDLPIRQNKDKELFVAMPSYHSVKNEWKDLAYPTKRKLTNELNSMIIAEYEKAFNENLDDLGFNIIPEELPFEKGTFDNKAIKKAEEKIKAANKALIAEAEQIFGNEEKKVPIFTKSSLKANLAEKKAAEKAAPTIKEQKKNEQSL